MTFTFEERPNSPTISGNTYTSRWRSTGSISATYVRSYAVGATPQVVAIPSLGTLYRQDIQIEPGGNDLYYITTPYGPNPSEGELKIDFDTTGGTVSVKNSKETKGSYGSGTVPDLNTLIGVEGDQVHGTEVVIPALKLSVTVSHPLGIITLPQIKAIAEITGTINSSTFLSFAAGEVLFLGATGSDGTNTPVSITYQFAMSKNASGLTIGAITDIAKRGWDYAWISYKDDVVSSHLVKLPEFVYVERVYEETDLAAVLGFG